MADDGNVRKEQEIITNRRRLLEIVERLLRRDAVQPLLKLLTRVLPADLSYLLETLPLDVAEQLFGQLPQNTAASVLREVTPFLQRHLVSTVELANIIPILELMAPDARTDIIAQLEPELSSRILARFQTQTRQDVKSLMRYQEDTAGGVMTSQFFALPEATSVTQAIEAVRSLGSYEMVFYLYVVNDAGCLTGVSSLRQLLLAKPDQELRQIMNTRIVKVTTGTLAEDVADIASQYRLLAVPVVDEVGVLVGMITVDDLIHVIREEAADDLLEAAGTSTREVEANSPWKIFTLRNPGLSLPFLGGLLACGVVMLFEEQHLPDTMAMMAFLPLILGLTGNFGTVASTLVVHVMGSDPLPWRDFFLLLAKEVSVGVLLGFFYGLAAGGVALWMFKDSTLAATMLLSILFNMVMAGTMAVILPMLFHRWGADPARVTRPVVTMSVDLTGVVFYFLIGWVMQHYLPEHLLTP